MELRTICGSFIDRAHSLGLGVILDVVYNHFGPDGNYLGAFSDDYLTRGNENEWGDAVNFDGRNSEPVREFFITNGCYWIEEFHFDGFRFDALHAIRDQSSEYIIGAVGRAARKAAGARSIILIAENDRQEARMVRPGDQGGDDLDGMWNDDFHHSAVVALTGARKPTMTITAERHRSLFPLQNTVSFTKVRRSHGEKHCGDLPLSAFPRRPSSALSKTTIKSRIPDPVNESVFKLHPRVIAR